MQLFVSLLNGLSRPGGKRVLLRVSLKLLAGHFSARMALYACGASGVDYAVWPDGTAGDPLLGDIKECLVPMSNGVCYSRLKGED